MATENKNLSNYDKNTIPSAKDFRFGIVVSEWNENVTEGLYKGAFEALLQIVVALPGKYFSCGMFQVVLSLIYGLIKCIATTYKYDAIITNWLCYKR